MVRWNINHPRTCKFCRSKKSIVWHLDKWGDIGWYCHLCYNAITYAEKTINDFLKRTRISHYSERKCKNCNDLETTFYWHRTADGQSWLCQNCFTISRRKGVVLN